VNGVGSWLADPPHHVITVMDAEGTLSKLLLGLGSLCIPGNERKITVPGQGASIDRPPSFPAIGTSLS